MLGPEDPMIALLAIALAHGADPSHGAALYADHCALCHGAAGEGHAADGAPTLATDELLAVYPERFLAAAIHYGRPGTPMSAWGRDRGGPFSPDDTADLVAWIGSWQDGPDRRLEPVSPWVGDPEAGAVTYGERCASCHGAEGEGDAGPRLASPVLLATAPAAALDRTIHQGRGEMPAFPELNRRHRLDLLAYLFTWSEPVTWVPVDGGPRMPEEVAIHPEGPEAALQPRDERFVEIVQVEAALARGERLVLVDARAPSDYLVGHAAGAVSIPFYAPDEGIAALPRDAWILAYCDCPHAASGRVVDALRAAGFAHAAILDEGFGSWQDRGLPVVVGAEPGSP